MGRLVATPGSSFLRGSHQPEGSPTRHSKVGVARRYGQPHGLELAPSALDRSADRAGQDLSQDVADTSGDITTQSPESANDQIRDARERVFETDAAQSGPRARVDHKRTTRLALRRKARNRTRTGDPFPTMTAASFRLPPAVRRICACAAISRLFPQYSPAAVSRGCVAHALPRPLAISRSTALSF